MVKNYAFKFMFYILGLFILALAVVLVMRTNFGSGGWDAFNVNFSLLTKGRVSEGQSSIMIGLILLLLVLLYRRKGKYLFSLFPIFTTGIFIDLWNKVILKDFVLTNMPLRLIFFIIGVFLLPLGLSIMIQTDLSSMVYDEITYVLIEVTKVDSFSKVRIGFEIFSILMAILVGLLHNGKLNEVSIGTFIISFLLGPIIHMWNNILSKLKKTYKEKPLI